MARKLRPIHPGEILREEFMKPLSLSVSRIAKDLQVPANRISEIANERRGISPDTAMRLARYFDMTVDFWMNLQKDYDLRLAESHLPAISKQVKPLKRPTAPQAA